MRAIGDNDRMPELPEVESYARYFAKHALRQRIAGVRVLDGRILDTPKAKLTRTLTDRAFTKVRRHGKHFFAAAGDVWLHLHFGMSGDLTYYRDEPPPRFARVIFDFTNGAHLAFEDMRLFGVVGLATSPDDYIADHHLGPDPLDPAFHLRQFRELLEGRRGAIKALLMSQNVIAGVGNLYADETLYRSSIHPARPADQLSAAEVKAIFTTLRRVLNEAIAGRRIFLVNRREVGDPCPRCGGAMKRMVVGGRTTYFCSVHQR
jgi:formamidopyrimidine-DNA glycosylase